jgi:hypothetical protein
MKTEERLKHAEQTKKEESTSKKILEKQEVAHEPRQNRAKIMRRSVNSPVSATTK